MAEYIRDEINFHKFLNAMRQMHEVTFNDPADEKCAGRKTAGAYYACSGTYYA